MEQIKYEVIAIDPNYPEIKIIDFLWSLTLEHAKTLVLSKGYIPVRIRPFRAFGSQAQ